MGPELLKHLINLELLFFFLLVSWPEHRRSLLPPAGGPLQRYWRWFYFVWLCFSLQASEPSIEDLHLDKKESEVEVSLMEAEPEVQHVRELTTNVIFKYLFCFQEAKAIIAQRSGNPREFFKQKERAMTISVDTSPLSVHRTGKTFRPVSVQNVYQWWPGTV